MKLENNVEVENVVEVETMSVLHGLVAPPVFLPEPGSPPIEWSHWIRMFDNYAIAVQSALSEERKIALLLSCLGAEGSRIYYSLPFPTGKKETVYNDVKSVLETQFATFTNPIVYRYELFKRSQLESESIEQYVAALREIVKKCAYSDVKQESEAVRDQLVFKCKSIRVRKALLDMKDLTLEAAIEKARHVEAVERDLECFPENKPVQVAANSFSKRQKNDQASSKDAKYTRDVKCTRCCGPHYATYRSCPAKNSICAKCSKKGHYARACLSKKSTSSTKSTSSKPATAAATEIELQETTVLAVNTPAAQHVSAIVQIGKNVINLTVDSGSPKTIISSAVYEKFSEPKALQKSDVIIKDAQGNIIPCRGFFDEEIYFKDRSVLARIYVAEFRMCLLGLPEMKELNLTLAFSPREVKICATSGESVGSKKMPLVKGFAHQIILKPGAKPVKSKLRPIPFSVREKVSEELRKWEEQDIIERVTDAVDWVSPIVVASRKDGSIRLCVDLRGLNSQIVTNKYPLPSLDELFVGLSGATHFTTLDLSNAYLHVPLTEDSKQYTNFITHDGIFRMKRLPFGLSSAASFFQEMMSKILHDVPRTKIILDDVLCYGIGKENCDAIYRLAKRRLEEHNLSLKPEKCHINEPEVKFVGRMLSEKGISPDPNAVSDLLKMPVPKDRQQLRSFIGFCSWHRNFVPNFATIVEPLTVLLSPKVPYNWSKNCEKAFNDIRDKISKYVSLQVYDPSRKTILESDASDVGIGGCLLQIIDGKEVPICYVSRVLNPAEKKYSIGEKEALAVVFCVSRLHKYLWGREFTIRTDHSSLTTLLSTNESARKSFRISRWCARLIPYNYSVEFKKGKSMLIADALSRLPNSNLDPNNYEKEFFICYTEPDTCLSLKKIKEAAQKDENYQKLISFIQNRSFCDDPYVKSYSKVYPELSVIDDIILRGERIVLPASLTHKAVVLAHEGHQGMVRSKQRLREYYYWSGIDLDVEIFVRNCSLCLATDRPTRQFNPPMQSVSYPKKPWSKLAMDIVGPFEALPQKYRFAITLIDYHSKWPEVCFSNTVTSKVIINFLKTVFAREGFCDEIVTDNGKSFISAEINAFFSERGIRHSLSAIYNPQSNGEIERFNRVLKHQIILAHTAKKDVDMYVRDFLFHYRNTVHATTNYAPSVLLHGRLARTKLTPSGVHQLMPIPSKILEDRVALMQKKYKDYYDARKNTKSPVLRVGQNVRVKGAPHSKLKPSFSEPRRVDKIIGPSTAVVDGKIQSLRNLSPT